MQPRPTILDIQNGTSLDLLHGRTECSHFHRGPSRPADAPDATSIQNPLIGDRAWFHRYDPSSPPIYIGEAACSAFATRFRRFLTGNNATAHITRTQWEREETIAAAANEADAQWPSLHHARLLVRIAIHQIGYLYHLMMRKSTLDKLEEIYQTGDFDCTANKCKFFALFAFGQAYSIRSEPASGLRVPGTAYFARAMSLVQVLPERTSITHLETLLLLVSRLKLSQTMRSTLLMSSPSSPTTSTAGTQPTCSSAMPCAWV